MKNNIETIISGQWDEIKGAIQNEWGKLTDQDLDKIDGSYEELVGKLKKVYGYKAAEAEEKLIELFSEFDDTSNNAKNLTESLKAQGNHIKSIVEDCVAKYFDRAKDVGTNMEENMIQYCKKNPLKTIGFAALAGYAFASVVHGKKDR